MLDLGMEDASRDYSACLEIILAQSRAAALVNCQVGSNISSKSSKHPNLGCPGQHSSALRHTVLGPRHSCQASGSGSQHRAEEQVRGGSNCWNTSLHHGGISQHILSEGTLPTFRVFVPNILHFSRRAIQPTKTSRLHLITVSSPRLEERNLKRLSGRTRSPKATLPLLRRTCCGTWPDPETTATCSNTLSSPASLLSSGRGSTITTMPISSALPFSLPSSQRISSPTTGDSP